MDVSLVLSDTNAPAHPKALSVIWNCWLLEKTCFLFSTYSGFTQSKCSASLCVFKSSGWSVCVCVRVRVCCSCFVPM